ncbi:MAG: hypothetical protein EOT05_00420 [Candidatus Microsaccharimonas sossegonensis]|uniref:PKD domain-containing protein n=1 Tax=Candidatus Microsaccharimonas sossegonensis TaxID=2506948 RepID=A0A4Q0AGE5_9BACT|nr:MAG: hypothetical protein EOT05_00420 [Candidatus Microsaccharimonas sossegonensis]
MTKQKKTKGLLAYHIGASLVSIAPHPHTGRRIHRRHTSHGALILILLLTGILLFNNLSALRAFGLQSSGSTTVTVNVAGNPPSTGADITYPTNNSITRSPEIQVVGTCPAQLLVATYNNGMFAGSSICKNDSTYATVIQLVVGTNILQSQDYDGLNQPGPATSQVRITRMQDPSANGNGTPTIATSPNDIVPNPKPSVAEPAPQPSVNPCFDMSKTKALNPVNPTIIANCIKRSVFTGDTVSLPIRVTGGNAPYALLINWGDGTTDLKTVLTTEYTNYQHTYNTAGIIGVSIKVTDAKGVTSFLQTVVQVNGSTTPGVKTSPFTNIINGLGTVWTDAPVPLYVAAVTLVLGFWVGDIFQRLFANDGKRVKSRKA